jgi:hypothetical protein
MCLQLFTCVTVKSLSTTVLSDRLSIGTDRRRAVIDSHHEYCSLINRIRFQDFADLLSWVGFLWSMRSMVLELYRPFPFLPESTACAEESSHF